MCALFQMYYLSKFIANYSSHSLNNLLLQKILSSDLSKTQPECLLYLVARLPTVSLE